MVKHVSRPMSTVYIEVLIKHTNQLTLPFSIMYNDKGSNVQKGSTGSGHPALTPDRVTAVDRDVPRY